MQMKSLAANIGRAFAQFPFRTNTLTNFPSRIRMDSAIVAISQFPTAYQIDLYINLVLWQSTYIWYPMADRSKYNWHHVENYNYINSIIQIEIVSDCVILTG